jgi:hypothetical protein
VAGVKVNLGNEIKSVLDPVVSGRLPRCSHACATIRRSSAPP